MADRTLAERLQPSLLDRLTDDAPTDQRESRDARVIDIRRLRDIVQRDLSWLLNTNNAESWIDPERHPNVARSVLNYGLREVAGDFSTGERTEAIRKAIQKAVDLFEPRIRTGSTHVELRNAETAHETVISYDIRADMWAEPIPIELYLRSDVDVTTGHVSLERVG